MHANFKINFIFFNKVPGLTNNVNQNDLINMGFRMVYNYPYNHPTTSTEILNIRSQCSLNTLMCVGGSSIYNDLLLLVLACANCLSVTTQTIINQPIFSGSAY